MDGAAPSDRHALSADARWRLASDVPDGQALDFDRDYQMFRLTVHTKDVSARVELAALPIKGFAQAEYRRQFDRMADRRLFLLLFPIAAAQGRQGAAPAVDMKAATKPEVMVALRQSMAYCEAVLKECDDRQLNER